MTITNDGAGWLRAEPLPAALAERCYDPSRLHNRTVHAFEAERSLDSHGGGLTRHERAILALAHGIDQYVGSAPDHADPLSGAWLHQVVQGFRGLLNYDLGRLDGGTLDTWACGVLSRWGVDPDTGEWTGGA